MRDLRFDDHRKSIVLASQDVYLFHCTIAKTMLMPIQSETCSKYEGLLRSHNLASLYNTSAQIPYPGWGKGASVFPEDSYSD